MSRAKFWFRFVLIAVTTFLVWGLIFGSWYASRAEASEPVNGKHANKEKCIVPSEFGSLKRGMTKFKVFKILDGRGRHSKTDGSIYWQVCDKPYGHARAFLYFNKDRVLVDGLWVVANGVVTRAA